MQIASGRIADTYAADIRCPWCEMSKLRYEMEFEVLTLEQKQVIDSIYSHWSYELDLNFLENEDFFDNFLF